MPSILIEDFGDHLLWTASDSGGLPTAEIALATDTQLHADVEDTASLRLEITAAAGDHFISRSVGPVDVGTATELRLWFRTTWSAAGTPNQPFQLRMELGSAALPVGAPGNGWLRYLPSFGSDRWHFVRLTLDDLDPLVAGALDEVRITCVNVTGSWTAWLDNLVATDPQMIGDVDTALASVLDGQLDLGGPVPAQVHVPGAAEPAAPWLRIVQYEAAFSDLRTSSRRNRTDFTDAGFRLRPESVAYDVYYRIEPVTTDRAEYASMIQFILDVLGHRGSLLVNGVQLPLERYQGGHPDDMLSDVPILRYRVATSQERGVHQVAAPTGEVVLAIEHTQ